MRSTLVESPIEETVDSLIKELLALLPDPKQLSSERRRGIIARYTAVLEGNFIYWMTAAYLAVQSQAAREIVVHNLLEEVRDCHPAMLRKFAMAAHAFPTDSDALAVHDELTEVRLFLGRLSGARTVLTMAFFEGFIQQFMPYLAALAADQGSAEQEYTTVHGVCDIEHTAELYRALSLELHAPEAAPQLFEGVELLRDLILAIVQPELAGAAT